MPTFQFAVFLANFSVLLLSPSTMWDMRMRRKCTPEWVSERIRKQNKNNFICTLNTIINIRNNPGISLFKTKVRDTARFS